MLELPSQGVVHSVKIHKCNLGVICDWIEANITFCVDQVTITDIADELLSHEVYEKQELAREFVLMCWEELFIRAKAYGQELTFSVGKSRLDRIANWDEKLGHAFCLITSLAPNYSWWKEHSYNDQGLIFEELSTHSITNILDFETYPTGWSSDNTKGFREHVDEICKRLNFGGGNIAKWDGANKKEYGLDILAYYDFDDSRTGIPYYMFQCASGQNWRTKLQTPDLNIWNEVLNPSVKAFRGFAIPFCLETSEFERSCTKVGGIMLDRTRLLGASRKPSYNLSPQLKQKISAWCSPRITWLLGGAMP